MTSSLNIGRVNLTNSSTASQRDRQSDRQSDDRKSVRHKVRQKDSLLDIIYKHSLANSNCSLMVK